MFVLQPNVTRCLSSQSSDCTLCDTIFFNTPRFVYLLLRRPAKNVPEKVKAGLVTIIGLLYLVRHMKDTESAMCRKAYAIRFGVTAISAEIGAPVESTSYSVSYSLTNRSWTSSRVLSSWPQCVVCYEELYQPGSYIDLNIKIVLSATQHLIPPSSSGNYVCMLPSHLVILWSSTS